MFDFGMTNLEEVARLEGPVAVERSLEKIGSCRNVIRDLAAGSALQPDRKARLEKIDNGMAAAVVVLESFMIALKK